MRELQPFFSVPGRTKGARLLLISYHFPPAQTAGALRWQKMAAFGAQRGWLLDVLCASPECLDRQDPRRLEELPPGTRVYGVVNSVPLRVLSDRSLRPLIRRLLPFRSQPASRRHEGGERHHEPTPDMVPVEVIYELGQLNPQAAVRAYNAWLEIGKERAWNRQAARIAKGLLSHGGHRAVISCGPPQLVHDVAYSLARRYCLPHIMDLRDPWRLVRRVSAYAASPLLLRTNRRLERRCVTRAALVVTVTDSHTEALRSLYPEAAERIVTVMNGYDREVIRRTSRNDRFVVAYAGEVYRDRDPRGLFQAAARLIHGRSLLPKDFGLAFMGPSLSYGGVPLQVLAKREGIADYLDLRPAGSRSEALEFLGGAQMLVNLPQDDYLAIPSKIFEYMPFAAWVLAMEEPGSATERLLRGTTADVVRRDDIGQITRVLESRFNNYKRGIRPQPLAVDQRFSRRYQAKLFFEALERNLGVRLTK